MSFPEPVELPDSIYKARKSRSRALIHMTIWGIVIRFLIALFELGGYAIFNSSALLLDALSTFADVSSSLLLIISIKLAERPPDIEHPFGHGRYEPLAGLQLGIFLTVAGFGIFIQQLISFSYLPEVGHVNPKAWLLPLIACGLLEFAYRRMKNAALHESSPALASEAMHFRVDSLNSMLALIALVVAAIYPEVSWIIDKVGALAIALFMACVGLMAAKNNLNQVLDRAPDEKYFTLVRDAARSVAGILETEKIRIQQYGPDAHVNIDVEVDPTLSVERAHELSQQVRLRIQERWPQVREVVVHIEPFYANDHA